MMEMEVSSTPETPDRVVQLMEVYEDIHRTLAALRPALEQIHASKPISIEHTLQLAERLSYSAFAPRGWVEGYQLFNKFPPAPQPEQMRIGCLAAYNEAHPGQVPNTSAAATDEDKKGAFVERIRRGLSVAAETEKIPSSVATDAAEAMPEVKKARSKVARFDVMDSDSD